MEAASVNGCFGGFDVQFVREHLDDFNCTLPNADNDDTLNKLNALSLTYSINKTDLLDGVIAFMKNCKKSEVSLYLLEDYDQQVLSKSSRTAAANKPTANFQSERQILRELSFVADLADVSVMDDGMEEAVQNFDDDKNYTLHNKKKRDLQNNLTNTGIERSVKSKYTGSNFTPSDWRTGALVQPLVSYNVISECDPTSYRYGHSNISSDIYELFSSEFSQEEEVGAADAENQGAPSIVTGSIYPSEGIHLNFDNAFLLTNSKCFSLDFENVEKISIFPGMNITAKCVFERDICRIEHIIEPPYLEIARLHHASQLSHLKVLIACGPYLDGTWNNDLIAQLFSSLTFASANALILIGPFVPYNMEFSTNSSQALFYDFLNQLLKHIGNKKIRVFLLPNAQSDLNSMPYFPTPPLTCPSTLTSNSLTFLPDPAVFEIEGVRFAISSSEILMHLCRKECYKSANMENEDRMHRLISHLFRSDSLYPLYPSDLGLPFSLLNSRNKLRLQKKPHVLILPSVLQPITKVVDGCVFINPGRFIRGKGSAGTFSFLDVDLGSALVSCPTADVGVSISQFCEVSLLSAQS